MVEMFGKFWRKNKKSLFALAKGDSNNLYSGGQVCNFQALSFFRML